MTADDILLDQVKKHVTALFNSSAVPALKFHNLAHTETVARRTREIALALALDEDMTVLVSIAALFHDTGYLFAEPKMHEEKSVELMTAWANERLSTARISLLSECIMSTKFGVVPQTTMQKVICDADTYHLGTAEFAVSNEAVFSEFKFYRPGLTRGQFKAETLQMLRSHRYHTAYCRELLTAGKEKNIRSLL